MFKKRQKKKNKHLGKFIKHFLERKQRMEHKIMTQIEN